MAKSQKLGAIGEARSCDSLPRLGFPPRGPGRASEPAGDIAVSFQPQPLASFLGPWDLPLLVACPLTPKSVLVLTPGPALLSAAPHSVLAPIRGSTQLSRHTANFRFIRTGPPTPQGSQSPGLQHNLWRSGQEPHVERSIWGGVCAKGSAHPIALHNSHPASLKGPQGEGQSWRLAVLHQPWEGVPSVVGTSALGAGVSGALGLSVSRTQPRRLRFSSHTGSPCPVP